MFQSTHTLLCSGKGQKIGSLAHLFLRELMTCNVLHLGVVRHRVDREVDAVRPAYRLWRTMVSHEVTATVCVHVDCFSQQYWNEMYSMHVVQQACRCRVLLQLHVC